MPGKGQSDGFQVGATSGQRLPVSEYAKLVFREEFWGRFGGQMPNHLGFSVSVGANRSESWLGFILGDHAQICLHQ